LRHVAIAPDHAAFMNSSAIPAHSYAPPAPLLTERARVVAVVRGSPPDLCLLHSVLRI
jgi:hypothetical protein